MKKGICLLMFLWVICAILISCGAKSAKITEMQSDPAMDLQEDNPFYDVYQQALKFNGQWVLKTDSDVYYVSTVQEKKSVTIAKKTTEELTSISYDYVRKVYGLEVRNSKTDSLIQEGGISEREATKMCNILIREIRIVLIMRSLKLKKMDKE